MSADPTSNQSEALPGPPAGLEENTEMEFQVAPMVDVLLVLLLFFMATATTEVMTQTANLTLPKADQSKPIEKGMSELTVNVEKLNFQIKMNDVYYDDPDKIVPIVSGAYQEYLKNPNPNKKEFRVVIRADEKTPFERISGIMAACAKAGVLNVVFFASDPHDKQQQQAQ